MGFAEPLGVIINMKDPQSPEDEQYDRWLRQDPRIAASAADPARGPAADGRLFLAGAASYWAKYPGQTGDHLRYLTAELLERIAAAQNGQRR